MLVLGVLAFLMSEVPLYLTAGRGSASWSRSGERSATVNSLKPQGQWNLATPSQDSAHVGAIGLSSGMGYLQLGVEDQAAEIPEVVNEAVQVRDVVRDIPQTCRDLVFEAHRLLCHPA